MITGILATASASLATIISILATVTRNLEAIARVLEATVMRRQTIVTILMSVFRKIKSVYFVCFDISINFDAVNNKTGIDMTWIIVVAVVVLLVIWVIGIYNNLVRLRNNRENAFANIDVQLKQRYDLVPQLVATVKGYAEHEKEVFQRVTEARAAAMGATTINDKIAADNALSSALAGLKVSLEAYPELKANTNFLQLQNEVADIENKLAAVRRFFNSATRELNNAVETFPSNIFAGMFGFHKEMMFEIPQESRAMVDKAPEIKF